MKTSNRIPAKPSIKVRTSIRAGGLNIFGNYNHNRIVVGAGR